MSDQFDWIDNEFMSRRGSSIPDVFLDLITSQLPLPDQQDLIEEILEDDELLADFTQAWSGLIADGSLGPLSGIQAIEYLRTLSQVVEARQSGPVALARLIARADCPAWSKSQAEAYRGAMLSGFDVPRLGNSGWVVEAVTNTGDRRIKELSSWSEYIDTHRSGESREVANIEQMAQAQFERLSPILRCAGNEYRVAENAMSLTAISVGLPLSHVGLPPESSDWYGLQFILQGSSRIPPDEAMLVLGFPVREQRTAFVATPLDLIERNTWAGWAPIDPAAQVPRLIVETAYVLLDAGRMLDDVRRQNPTKTQSQEEEEQESERE